jgi:guanyl-specific ribonuclease Sa
MVNLLRSNKYRSFNDEKIVTLFNDQPKGEAKYFLQVEVETRGLEEKAAFRFQQGKKKTSHSAWYYVFYAIMLGFMVAKFAGQLF